MRPWPGVGRTQASLFGADSRVPPVGSLPAHTEGAESGRIVPKGSVSARAMTA